MAKAETSSAKDSAKHEVQGQQEASQAVLARLKRTHELELQALRKSADDVLTKKVASVEAEATKRLGAALATARRQQAVCGSVVVPRSLEEGSMAHSEEDFHEILNAESFVDREALAAAALRAGRRRRWPVSCLCSHLRQVALRGSSTPSYR